MLGLRHIANPAFLRYARFITKQAKENVGDILQFSRDRVIEFYKEELKRVPDGNGILNLDVTFDGSWHKRGYKSNYGMGAVIDAHTGLILDYEVLSKECLLCDKKSKELEGKEEEYDEWKASHAPSCPRNYEGTSGGMEPEAARRMWSRSLDYNCRYLHFISDGDSSAYLAVKGLNNGDGPYGKDYVVAKEECVNHVQKRLGTALRNLGGTQRVKSGYGGLGKLTTNAIDRLEYYFGAGVKRAVNTTPKEMCDSIMSSFYHCTSTDANPNHHLCPKSEESWCFYQEAVAKGEQPKSHAEMEFHIKLGAEQLENMKKVYDRLTTDEMMLRCLRGLTQNANESLHSRIWKYCPKTKNITKGQLDFATATAISIHNSGYLLSNINNRLGIPFTKTLESYLTRMDKQMDIPIKRRMKNKKLAKELSYGRGAF